MKRRLLLATAATLLAMPARLGTPAAPNSRRVTNAGPTFSGLRHAPVVPSPNQPVTLSVCAADPDGVASATLNYRINPAASFTALPMTRQSGGALVLSGCLTRVRRGASSSLFRV